MKLGLTGSISTTISLSSQTHDSFCQTVISVIGNNVAWTNMIDNDFTGIV